MSRRTKVGLIIALVLMILSVPVFFHTRSMRRPLTLKGAFPVMGTIASYSLYGTDEKQLLDAEKAIKAEFEKVVKLANLYDPASELSRLNANASKQHFKCSQELWFLLKRAGTAWSESDRQFDITVKPLMELWGFYRKKGKDSLPSNAEIKNTLTRVGFEKLRFNDAEKSVSFSIDGMKLDLGGIAKGYAVDRAAAAVIRCGITSGVIDLGGNLYLLPQPPEGKKFYSVAMRDPANPAGILPQKLELPGSTAVATSGDYERFVIINGKRFGHIISPVTGRPGVARTVTVTTSSALDSDIFSTSVYLGGASVADKISKLYPGTRFIFYNK